MIFENIWIDIFIYFKSHFLTPLLVAYNMLNQHKTELTSVGLKYYNQMMAYASGFYRKYDKWPKQLIVLNFYTCEVIAWTPSRKDYLKFNKML